MLQINNILCVVEADSNSVAALNQAIQIAEDQQAKVTFASVLRIPMSVQNMFKDNNEIAVNLKELADAKRDAIALWLKQHRAMANIEVEVYTGIGFIEVIQSVIRNKYDLVVKYADDLDWLNRLFASDDMQLLRKCPCPVLIVKPGQNSAFRHILATVDVNDEVNELDDNRVQNKLNKKVLHYSALFSVAHLTELHIGSVWQAYAEDFLRYGPFANMSDEKIDFYQQQTRRDCMFSLNFLVKELRDLMGTQTVEFLHPIVHLVNGEPAKEIPLMVTKHKVDLIVMGTVARTGIPGFIIGSTAESILEQVQCSVLAIKPDGFKSPIEA